MASHHSEPTCAVVVRAAPGSSKGLFLIPRLSDHEHVGKDARGLQRQTGRIAPSALSISPGSKSLPEARF